MDVHGFLLTKVAPSLTAGSGAAARYLECVSTEFQHKAWPSYALLAALQVKILWNVWLYRDLTFGDTSSYFEMAYRWYERLAVNIVRCPLYTAFYGSVLLLTGGHAYAATILHRIIIVLVATLGVLAVARRLLPPAIALLIGWWWAILPINFDTLYEVHLFAVLPILAAWLIAMSKAVWRRGAALAVLAVTTVLLRNELIVATVLYAIACVAQEIAGMKRGRNSGEPAWRRHTAAYGLPLLCAMLVCAFFYWRSDVQFPFINAVADGKHRQNMCETYAFGYAQRHPEWNLSPWTDCRGLMAELFGRPSPSLREMIGSNPGAVWEHLQWNISLTPSGFQVALFNSMSGVVNPDYVPVTRSQNALYLSLAALLVVGLGAAAALRERERWRAWIRERADAWAIMIPVFCVAAPVILTQRPRPSYLFAATLVVMVIVGSTLHVLTNRWRLGVKIIAPLGGAILLVAVPPYYHPASGRPLYENFKTLEPFGPALRRSQSSILLGDYSYDLTNYLRLTHHNYDYNVIAAWDRREELSEFLRRTGIGVAYFQPRMLIALKDEPHAERLLRQPESQCWRRLGEETKEASEWLLVQHDQTAGGACPR